MIVTQGNTTNAVDIIREAASWLIDTGKAMWRLDDVTEAKILDRISPSNVYVGWIDEESAAAMVLLWKDPVFWPQVSDDSGFIHRLSVRRKFAGTGIAREMVEWARQEARRRGKTYLRLECEAGRPKLCAFYEEMSFQRLDLRQVGPFDMAFYQVKLTSTFLRSGIISSSATKTTGMP